MYNMTIVDREHGCVGIYVPAFRPDRKLNTVERPCSYCDTVCKPGTAGMFRGGVVCGGCSVAYATRGPGASANDRPAGWPEPRERFTVGGMQYTTPHGAVCNTPREAVRAEIERLKAENARLRPVAKPAPSLAASNAGRALAARKAELAARKLAAK